jgi:hypothetical protein
MPIDAKIGKSKEDSEAMSSAKGKSNRSFANTIFGTVDDFFYEFGVIGKSRPEKGKRNKGGIAPPWIY